MKSGRPNANKNLAKGKRLPTAQETPCKSYCGKCSKDCNQGNSAHRGDHGCGRHSWK